MTANHDSFDEHTGDAARPGRPLVRALGGGVIVAAVLAVPEISVGAGDLTGASTPADPLGPSATTFGDGLVTAAEHRAARARPGLRNAGLGTVQAQALAFAPSARAVTASSPSVSPASAPEKLAADHVPVALPAAPAGAQGAPPAAMAAASAPSLPEAVAAAPFAAPAPLNAPPLSGRAPTPGARETAEVSASYAAVMPDERAAPRTPAAAAPPAAPVVAASVPTAAVPVAAAPPPAAAPALAAAPTAAAPGRAAMEQLTTLRGDAAKAPSAPAVRRAPALAPPPSAPRAATAPAARLPAAAAPAPAPAASKPVAAAPQRIAPRPAAKPPAVPGARSAATRPGAPPAPLAAVAPRPAPAIAQPSAAQPSAPVLGDVRSRLLTRVEGRAIGQVDFQQTAAGLKVRLGSIAEVLADRIAPAELARIRSSSAGQAYLSLAELQAQGVPISYDPVYDEFNIGNRDTRPRNAHKVHIDQIGTPRSGIVPPAR